MSNKNSVTLLSALADGLAIARRPHYCTCLSVGPSVALAVRGIVSFEGSIFMYSSFLVVVVRPQVVLISQLRYRIMITPTAGVDLV